MKPRTEWHGRRETSWMSGWIRGMAAIAVLGISTLVTNGCTVVMGTAGAVLDTVVITSPVWGPSVVNLGKLDHVQRETSLYRIVDPERASELVVAGESSEPQIVVRPFRSWVSPSSEIGHSYYSWWAMCPLVPYANQKARISRGGKIGDDEVLFMGPAAKEKTSQIPLDRFPPELRPTTDEAVEGYSRSVAMDLLRGEIASQPLTQKDSASAFTFSRRQQFLFEVTHLTRQQMAERLLPYEVGIELPQCQGRYGFNDWGAVAQNERAFLDSQGTVRTDPQNRTEASPILFSVKPEVVEATVPNGLLYVQGNATGYPKSSPRIIVSGKLTALRFEVSSISYGVTTIGANLLSFFGLPLSSSRVVMKLELEARRGSDNKLLESRMIELVTPRKVSSLYYGGDIASDIGEDLQNQYIAEVSNFSESLRPYLRPANSEVTASSSSR